MKMLLLLLTLTVMCSCGPSRNTRLSQENERLYRENENLRETSSNRTGYSTHIPSVKIVHGIRGIIIAKSITKNSKIYYFYIRLENNKEIKWTTTAEKFHSKQIGSSVYFDYVGAYRFQDKLQR